MKMFQGSDHVQRARGWGPRQLATADFWAGNLLVLLTAGVLPAFEQGESEFLPPPGESAEDVAAAGAAHDAEAFEKGIRDQQHLVAKQLLLGKIARRNGDTPEAISWYLQAYLNSDPATAARRSARNLIGAWGGDLKQTLVHDRPVKVVAVDPEGKTLLVGYQHNGSQLWDLSTGRPIGEPQRSAGTMMSAEISPEGSFVLTADWRGAKVWDAATGNLRYPALEHELREDTIVAPRLSPDGRVIATRSSLHEIRLWDAQSGEPRGPARPHGTIVGRILFSPDSRRVVVLGGGVVRLWDVESTEPIGEPLRGVADVAVHPESPWIATAGRDGKLRILEIESGRTIAERDHGVALSSVQFDSTGRHLLTYKSRIIDRKFSDTENAWLWFNAAGSEAELREIPHGTGLLGASFSPNGRYLLTIGRGLLRVLDLSSEPGTVPARVLWERRALPVEKNDRRSRLKSAQFSPDSRSLLVTMENETANVFAVRDGRLLVREHQVHDATFAADGATIVFASSERWVRTRSLHPSDPRRLPTVPLPEGMGRVRVVSFSPDGDLALIAGEGAQLCRTDTWQPVGEPLPHEWEVIRAAFSPDGRTLVTSMWGPRPGIVGTAPGRLRFWNVATGKLIGEPLPLERFGSPLAFDETGETVRVGSKWLCNVKTRELFALDSLEIPEGERAVARLASYGYDSVLPPLWDSENDRPTRIRMPEEGVVRALLMRDGRRLLTMRGDGTCRLWDLDTGQPLGPRFRAEGRLRQSAPDGKSVLFGTRTSLSLWDPYSGRPHGEPLINQPANISATFSPSGDMLATVWDFRAQLRDSGTGQALTGLLSLPSNHAERALFTPDGQQLLVISRGVQRWRVPTPAVDEPLRLQLSVEVLTGLAVDENGVLQQLTQAEWLERKRRLEQLGGSSDAAE